MNLSSIQNPNISTMSYSDAVEYLKSLRYSRRIPKRQQSKATQEKKAKAKALPKISKVDAQQLLKLLGGSN
jgi:ribosomal protein L22